MYTLKECFGLFFHQLSIIIPFCVISFSVVHLTLLFIIITITIIRSMFWVCTMHQYYRFCLTLYFNFFEDIVHSYLQQLLEINCEACSHSQRKEML
jgi:hypothetical protein